MKIAAACTLCLNRLAYAETYWREGIKVRPCFAETSDSLGMSLKSPDLSEVHNNRGTTLHNLRSLLDAAVAYRRPLTIRPDYVQAHFNIFRRQILPNGRPC